MGKEGFFTNYIALAKVMARGGGGGFGSCFVFLRKEVDMLTRTLEDKLG